MEDMATKLMESTVSIIALVSIRVLSVECVCVCVCAGLFPS